MMKKILFALTVLITVTVQANAQSGATDITYDLRFPNRAHHEADITLTLKNVKRDSVHIAMSRSSPGRYALHEFVKNVYGVTATDEQGDTLQTHRPDLHHWVIDGNHETIKFHYTLYGRHADGTYAGINREHAHLNSPATYAWVKERADQPVTVRFHLPEDSGWKVATQLKPTDDPNTFTAPDVSYLMDSPTELSNFDMNSWKLHSGGKTYTMRMAMHHNGTPKQFKTYVKMAQKVVDQQRAVFDELPDYDYGTYTFIVDFLPYVYRDGMEHRNSTIIINKHPLDDHPLQRLYTLAHEFFHCWNVERLRPVGLKPFDFERTDMSRTLWFAEGFTNYYDDLSIRRAGLINDSTYTRGWDGVLNYVLNSPGITFYSPVQMSMQSPFVDAATSIDGQNKSNTFISYYSWGSVIGLGLDLTLRTRFEDLTLDDFMRAMWQKYGKTEQAYTLDDLRQTLAEVTGDQTFADQFFNKYIAGHHLVDLKPLLARAGFQLRKANPGQAVISFRNAKINFKDHQAAVSTNTIIGSPLYEAGMDRGDILLKLDGKTIHNAKDINHLLAAHEPGDEISVTYKSLDQTISRKLTLAEDQTVEVLPFKATTKELTPAMKSFRKQWLGSHHKKDARSE